MEKAIVQNIKQVLLIVFSVVLGLYLSERIEERKNEKEAAKLLAKVKSELNENKKLLDVWVPYHREIVRSLDSLSQKEFFLEDFIEDKSALYQVVTKGTILSDMPSNDDWDIAKSHPLIVNFEYDELLILSKVYNQQKISFESLPNLIELVLSPDFNSRVQARPNLQLFRDKLNDIASRETQLIDYYNEADEILNFQSI